MPWQPILLAGTVPLLEPQAVSIRTPALPLGRGPMKATEDHDELVLSPEMEIH
jgi:hypothetical protein